MANILDKTDRSTQVMPIGEGTFNKRARYGWSPGGEPGSFRMLPKTLLNIDGRYQRGAVSDLKVNQIAKGWDWALLGAISVVERHGGSYWVLDGGHRTRAAFYRDDVTELPCMVYRFDDLSSEAKSFLGANLMTTNVAAVDKHKAAVCAKDERSLATDKILTDLGIEVNRGAMYTNQIKCINTVQRMVDRNPLLAKRCLEFMMAQAEGLPLSSKALLGLFEVSMRFAGEFDFLAKYGERLSKHSQKEIDVRIRQTSAELGKGGAVAGAIAILALVNKNCKYKLAFPQ